MSLALEEISHNFGATRAVDGASLKVADGEIFCLFGPSGCGKTTLLRIAAGLEPIQEGRVLIDGDEVAAPNNEMPPENRPIGFVFQDFVLFPHMTVERNIAFGIDQKGQARRDIVSRELAAVDLEGYERRFPHELSGGEQQRVALARAMARSPRALLLDEPFASIDTVVRRRLRENLRRLLKPRGVAVILVTHDPDEALALGDRIALMRHGAIVEARTPEELYRHPATPDGAGLFPDSQTVAGVVADGKINTPFGTFAAPELPDGNGVVVFRDGCLSVQEDADGRLRVADIRFRGPDWSVFLAGAGEAHLAVRAATPLVPGTRVTLKAAPDGIYSFAAPGPVRDPLAFGA